MHRRICATAAALATTLALAGCGGSGSGGDDTSASAPSQAVAQGSSAQVDPAAGATGKKTAATVGKTVYFGGYKLQVKSLTYNPASATDMSMEPNLVLRTTVTNLGEQTQDLSSMTMEINLASGNHHWTGQLPSSVSVPGKASSDTTIGFSVDQNFSLDNAVVTFGSADLAQSTMPLGGNGELVDNAPTDVPAGDPIDVTGTDAPGTSFKVTVTGGSVRSDYPGEFRQVAKGQRVLVLKYDVSLASDDEDAIETFSYDNLTITQEGGDTVSADDSTSAAYTVAENLEPGQTKHFIAEFVIDAPTADSAYTLNVKVEDTEVGLGGSSSTTFTGAGPLQLA